MPKENIGTKGENLERVDLASFPGARVGSGATIRCRHFSAVGAFTLGEGVTIEAETVHLGNHATIEANTQIRAIRGVMNRFQLGDESMIGGDSQVLVPDFVAGDYTRIFRSALINGYKPVVIGHNCWVGQGTILNSAEDLTIGNNVRMGGCQIWTHVASGELLEGSRFYGEHPVTIEDDVWLMGFGHTVAPGVVLRKGSVIMAGSAVTRSTEPFRTYSGVPARDVSDKLPAWDPMTLDDKLEMLKRFVAEFLADHPHWSASVQVVDNRTEEWRPESATARSSDGSLVFLASARSLDPYSACRVTVFDVETKTYIKRRSPLEIAWQNFAVGFRARFVPVNP